MPGPERTDFRCRHPCASIMIPTHTRASSTAKFAALLPRNTLPRTIGPPPPSSGAAARPNGRTLARSVTEVRHEARPGQEANRSFLGGVDHQCFPGLPVHHEGHHAVVTRGGALHHAVVAIDGQHGENDRTAV